MFLQAMEVVWLWIKIILWNFFSLFSQYVMVFSKIVDCSQMCSVQLKVALRPTKGLYICTGVSVFCPGTPCFSC